MCKSACSFHCAFRYSLHTKCIRSIIEALSHTRTACYQTRTILAANSVDVMESLVMLGRFAPAKRKLLDSHFLSLHAGNLTANKLAIEAGCARNLSSQHNHSLLSTQLNHFVSHLSHMIDLHTCHGGGDQASANH